MAAEGDWRGHERASRACELLGRHKEALEAAVAAAEGAPEEPRVLARAARLSVDAGRADLARGWVRRLLRAAPSDLEARLLMAHVELVQGHPTAAEAWLRRGLEINPHHNVFHLELARLAARREAWAQARRHFAAAVGMNPQVDAEANAQLGLACLHQNDPDAALDAFRAATNLAPQMPLPWYMLGLLTRQIDPTASDAALRRFLGLQPQGPEADRARALLEGRTP